MRKHKKLLYLNLFLLLIFFILILVPIFSKKLFTDYLNESIKTEISYWKNLREEANKELESNNTESAIKILNNIVENIPAEQRTNKLSGVLRESLLSLLKIHEKSLNKKRERVLKKLIKLDPNNANYHYKLAKYYYEKEDFKKALKAVKNSIELYPDFITAIELKSKILFKLKRDEEAKKVLDMTKNISYKIPYQKVQIFWGTPDVGFCKEQSVSVGYPLKYGESGNNIEFENFYGIPITTIRVDPFDSVGKFEIKDFKIYDTKGVLMKNIFLDSRFINIKEEGGILTTTNSDPQIIYRLSREVLIGKISFNIKLLK